jgi:hypothetical protein
MPCTNSPVVIVFLVMKTISIRPRPSISCLASVLALLVLVPLPAEGTEEAMINLTPRAVAVAALLVPTVAMGYVLSSTGQPYNQVLFTVHKLMPLAALVLLDLSAYQVHRFAGLTPVDTGLAIATNLCFIATIVTGGLVSLEATMPEAVRWVHRIGPWASVISSGALLYSLWRH